MNSCTFWIAQRIDKRKGEKKETGQERRGERKREKATGACVTREDVFLSCSVHARQKPKFRRAKEKTRIYPHVYERGWHGRQFELRSSGTAESVLERHTTSFPPLLADINVSSSTPALRR